MTFRFDLALINMKDSHNFYVGVSKPRLSVLGCLEQYNLHDTGGEIGGATYVWMRLIHGRLQYSIAIPCEQYLFTYLKLCAGLVLLALHPSSRQTLL